MSTEKEKQPKAMIWLNGEEVFHDDWRKVWRKVLNLVAQNKDNEGTEIVIELGREE